MKKIFTFLIIFLFSIQNVCASTNVYTRTEVDYLVPSDIEVTDYNKDDILSTPAINSSEKIYDFADLLTYSEEQSLYSDIVDYTENTNYDLAIVTIGENPKYSAMAYADDFYDYNDFGIGENRDGALILIDMDTREIWISTSGAAIDKYSDLRIDNIIDSGYNDLKNGNYYSSLQKIVDSMNISSNNNSTINYERTENDYLVPSDIEITDYNKDDILSTPVVDAEEKIYDFADLLTDSEEQKLYDEISKYIEASNYDLAIVTIDENPKNSAMNYADDFFDYNDFGIGKNRDGALILIDMDTREIWISTSGAAIDKYNDSRIESLLDAGYDELTNANYYDCLMDMVKKFESYHRMPYLMIAFISAMICLIVSLILYGKTRSVIKKHNTASYINVGNTNITKNDVFVTTYTSRVRRQSSSSSGGSSSHRSSSGRSHGGGGRRF